MDMGVPELGGFRIISYLTALLQTDRTVNHQILSGRRWIKAFTSCAREHLKGP